MHRTITPITAAATLIALAPTASLAGDYQIRRIDDLGGADTRALDINDNGQVVGHSFLPGATVSRAFVDDGNTMTLLPQLSAGSTTLAYAINNSGQIVGHEIDQTNFILSARLWDGATTTNLNTELGANAATARDINDNGLVVGQAAVGTSFSNGFVWDSVNGGEIVGTLDGRNGGSNLAVNNLAVAVGHSFFFGSPDQAHMVVPGDRGYASNVISAPFPGIGIAADINDNELIVGHANLTFGPATAVIFTPADRDYFIDLGTLPGAGTSAAFDTNESGVIVGTAGDNPAWTNGHAFIYDNGTMLDLNDLFSDPTNEWDTLVEAHAINNNGDIAGWGITNDGAISAFVLTAAATCPCERDGDDAQVDVADLLTYLALWFAADADAELTGDQPASIDSADLLAFLACWFSAANGAACN